MGTLVKNFLEDKKIIIMSWICFIVAMVQIFINKDNWEMITMLLSFSFFPNIMKEFIIRKYNLPENGVMATVEDGTKDEEVK